MSRSRSILILASLLFSGATQAAPAAPCTDPEFHQFDFWIGDWRVRKADGGLAGMNRISAEYGGCVVHEHYVTGKGYSGESLNIYDASRKVWHQAWVDSTGLLLTLEGHLVGKDMVLEGESVQPDGRSARQRITWTPNPDGSVRQLWESMNPKGRWTTAFDGRYTKK